MNQDKKEMLLELINCIDAGKVVKENGQKKRVSLKSFHDLRDTLF
jgi:hypothetical protein